MIYPTLVDHLVFRVAEIERTESFYRALLGQPVKTEDYIMYMAGDTRLFFTRSVESRQARHEKENIGLNHIAFGVRALKQLQTIQAQLDNSGISHSGIKFLARWRNGVHLAR
jgi:glyoxylase I family protein